MSSPEYTESIVWVAEDRQEWSPRITLIIAFIVGLLVLSPAILGIYWEKFMP